MCPQLGSMCDPSLPLTLSERREWGDPLESREVYDRIAAWSPYETLPDAVARGAELDAAAGAHSAAEGATASQATSFGRMGSKAATAASASSLQAGVPAPPPAGPVEEQGAQGGGGEGGQQGPVVVWPHMLVTASLHDERVPVWGPAK